MQKHLALIVPSFGLVAAIWLNIGMQDVSAQTSTPTAVFDSQGRLKLPTDYRKWVFVGAPLTPNALNGGSANFPEYHHVYIQEKNVDAFLKNGSFPEGTVIIKELTRVLTPSFPDGSTVQPSGRGYFNGEFNGIDATVKDSNRFASTNGWGFLHFRASPGTLHGVCRRGSGHAVCVLPPGLRSKNRHDLDSVLSHAPKKRS